MAAEKLSISLDEDLAAAVRAAASEQGVSVSTWLAGAALAQVQIDRLIADARHTSRVVTGTGGVA